MMTKLIKSTSTSVSTWMAWKRLRLVRRPNGRAEVRISVLTESSDTSRKCARQFLCNRSVVARKREKKKIHTQRTQLNADVTSCVPFSPGPEPTLFGKPKFCCMRLHYRNEETSGYFHTLRAATRNPEDDGKGGDFSRGKTSSLASSHILVWTYSVMLCRRHATVHS